MANELQRKEPDADLIKFEFRSHILSLIAIGFGVLLSAVGGLITLAWPAGWQYVIGVLVINLGATLMVGFGISIIWDFSSKKEFAQIIDKKMKIHSSFGEAGIEKAMIQFYEEVDWKGYLAGASFVDVMFIRNVQWIKERKGLLFPSKTTGIQKIRILLPDISNNELVRSLAVRHDNDIADERQKLKKAIEDIKSTLHEFEERVEIRLMSQPPRYSFYRFDNKLVLSIYAHKWSEKIPTLELKRSGTFFDVIENDFDTLWEKATPHWGGSKVAISANDDKKENEG